MDRSVNVLAVPVGACLCAVFIRVTETCVHGLHLNMDSVARILATVVVGNDRISFYSHVMSSKFRGLAL